VAQFFFDHFPERLEAPRGANCVFCGAMSKYRCPSCKVAVCTIFRECKNPVGNLISLPCYLLHHSQGFVAGFGRATPVKFHNRKTSPTIMSGPPFDQRSVQWLYSHFMTSAKLVGTDSTLFACVLCGKRQTFACTTCCGNDGKPVGLCWGEKVESCFLKFHLLPAYDRHCLLSGRTGHQSAHHPQCTATCCLHSG